jgi:hypothetical protein
MPRADLLALSPDDLAALTNRGTVKRAQREVEAEECAAELAEAPDGAVTAKWSDGVECVVPAGAVLADGRCSCAAVGLCRHLVRTVLAYQRQSAHAAAEGPGLPQGPWDPGAIADEELARHYRAAALAKLREQFEQGVLVELVRGAKPSARFHLQGCMLRFLVPGDPRYTHCDCAEPAPCGHAALAVWAFRRLPPDQSAAILATGAKAPPAPADLLDGIEAALLELTEFGVSGAAAAWAGRLAKLEEACRAADLVWPAEVLAELHQQHERYAAHDALFAPERVADLAGELLARCDAVRSDTGALPQLLVRGARGDKAGALGSARFIGLGCGARVRRRSVELTAYLQDSDSGSVVAVRREFPDGDPAQPPRPFAELAQVPAVKGSPFAALGAGQLLIRGGKRTAGYQLLPGRADASVQPQGFAWESLRPPVLAEELSELEARLSALPPASLRPRRVAEDFHVIAVAGAEAVQFVAATQTVQAVLADARGGRALLEHPYTSRGAAGAEALLARLASDADRLRFASGPVRRGPAGLVIQPVCLVWDEGGRRTALQPWVEAGACTPAGLSQATAAPAADAMGEYLGQLQGALGELLVLGLRRADALVARRWRQLQHQAEAVGLARLARRVAPLADALERKAHALDWDWRPAGRAVLALAVLVRLAQDVAGS